MRVGLALAGGGVRGAAHIGVIKALEENGITIEAIGGASSGSMVAVLYAMKYNTEEMLNLFNYFAKGVVGGDRRFLFFNVKENKNFQINGMRSRRKY